MKKFFKWLFLIAVPFGWLIYILFHQKMRKIFFWKVKKFFHSIAKNKRLTIF